jgi:hypothetical protein
VAAVELVNPLGADELDRDMPALYAGRPERLAAESFDLLDREVRRPDDRDLDQSYARLRSASAGRSSGASRCAWAS